METGLFDALESIRFAPSAVNKQPWRVVISQNAAYFYERHDKGFVTPDFDVQKIDMGIALYNFEKELKEEGRNPQLEVYEPGINAPENTDYIATIKW